MIFSFQLIDTMTLVFETNITRITVTVPPFSATTNTVKLGMKINSCYSTGNSYTKLKLLPFSI